MDITAIQTAIATDLATLGLRSFDHTPDSLKPPAAYTTFGGYDPQMSFGGASQQCALTVVLIAGAVNTKGGQQQLNDFLSPAGTHSVVAKLYGDPTLGGTVGSFTITRAGQNYGPRVLADTGVRYWVAELVLDVFT